MGCPPPVYGAAMQLQNLKLKEHCGIGDRRVIRVERPGSVMVLLNYHTRVRVHLRDVTTKR